ncbi:MULTISPECIES: histone deacetylase family protein [Thermodesulfovibrio]|uniref:histone deacetylase family protein n=1 Tax=Thermodesulfovibrio TaxID=28261 RepID=UPI002625D803|nr:histone deacetylase [Thermodesulfovibrio sp.]
MDRKVAFAYDDIFLKHETPEGHPESKERLISIVNRLKKETIWERLIHIKPRRATEEEIALVHEPHYIERVKNSPPGYIDPDTYISEYSYEAALHAVGAVLDAVDGVYSKEFDRVFCAVRPPGHHAEIDTAMGFCIFNNVSVGAAYAKTKGYRKIFIIDFDVHHGNGTQHIFEDDCSVFYFSSHQFPFYPGTGRELESGRGKGEGCTYNVPLRAGSGTREYLTIFQDIVPQKIREVKPDLILVSAGYDMHQDDPMSYINVTTEGVRSIVRSILNSSWAPKIFVLEGGYNLNSLAECVKVTLEEMLA